MKEKENVFELLAKPLQKLLAERGFDCPTLPQKKAVPHVLKGENTLLIAPAGTGKCVSGGTLILTERGLKEIGELYEQSVKVNSLNNGLKISPSLGAVIRKKRSKLYRLRTRTGRIVRVTDDHRFLTIDNDGPVWRELRNLEVGDYVAVARRLELNEEDDLQLTLASFERWLDRLTMRTEPSVSELLEKIEREKGMDIKKVAGVIGCSKETLRGGKKGSRITGATIQKLADLAGTDMDTINVRELGMPGGKSIEVPRIDERFAYFVGLLIGDGNINKSQTIRFSTTSKERLKDFSTYVRKLGLRVKKYDEKRCDYCVSSKPLVTLLYAIGFPQHNKAESVSIPNLFFKKRSLLSMVLRGVYDTDGSVHRNEIDLTTKSAKLAQGVLHGLLCFGIFPLLKEKVVKKNRYPRVVIGDVANRNLFYNHIGFNDRDKAKKLRSSLSVKSNPNVDLVPKIGNLLRKCKNGMEVKYSRATCYRLYEEYVNSIKNPSRASLRRVLRHFQKNQRLGTIPQEFQLLEKLANSDVFWDEIVEIEADGKDYVYDATVPAKGNFIGNGVVLHNTEAAFLPVLHKILEGQMARRRGIKVIYITPLRALNRDMLDRLRWWCRSLDFKISVRHGDTATRERRKQALSPPDVMITTPETLQLLLVGKRLSRHLSTVEWVIVDEVHELAENKRGAQLSLSLERLRRLKGGDFQTIGLSATVGSPNEVAKFLVGEGRPCEVIDVTMARKTELDLIYPKVSGGDEALASELYTYPAVAARLRVMRDLIEEHESTLIFTNTRPMTEILTSRFKMWDINFPVNIHHGSLSSFARLRTERGLKSGDLKGAIATSSMELGLDIGQMDLCIQYNSPRQVTRLMQRVGRSGHQITGVAKGRVVVKDPDDAIESAVIIDRSRRKELEEVKIPNKPYDVLAHELVGMLVASKQWGVDDALEIFRKAYPFRKLTKDELLEVLRFLGGMAERLVWLRPDEGVFVRPRRGKRVFDYYFNTLSMIPELKQYIVIDDEKDQGVGVLDEPFVAEYGEPGSKFVMGGSIWKIIQVFKNKVFVKSVDDPVGAVPSWVGEEIPVPYSVAQQVGAHRREVMEKINQGEDPEEAIQSVSRELDLGEDALNHTLKPAIDQVEAGLRVPTDDNIVIEKCEDTLVVHACFGTLTNRTLARFIARCASEELGETVAVTVDPYRILLRSERLTPSEIKYILSGEMGGDFRETLKSIIEDSRFFKWRIVQVARRMGALKHETEMTSGVVDKLTKGLKGTPVYKETFKEVVRKDLDLPQALEVLNRIKSGELELTSLGVREEPSPLTLPAWKERALTFEPVAPKRMRMLILASTRARLLSEERTFACTECKDWVEVKPIHKLGEKPTCPKCDSESIGMIEQETRAVRRILNRVRKSPKRGKKTNTWKELKETSEIISKYGKTAAAAIVGRGLTPESAEDILREEDEISTRFLDLIMREEKKALLHKYA